VSQEAEDEELRRKLKIAEIPAKLPRHLKLPMANEVLVWTQAARLSSVRLDHCSSGVQPLEGRFDRTLTFERTACSSWLLLP
jgi:hypothetical protein